ncbi:MAG: RIP metalloprotease [Deinococcota bacterium]|nr:RIP metalloprotease [Deinococcota bacterium]
MLTTVVVLLIINVAVFIHELAHYLNARSVGLSVRAFSIGMGPILLRKRWRGTEWRLSLLPLGGYVDLPGLAGEPGEDGKMTTPEHGFAKLNLWQKLWVLVGGVTANFVLAILLVATVIVLEPATRALTAGITVPTAAVFADVIADTKAQEVGVQAGDVVREMNGQANPDADEVRTMLQSDGPLILTLERQDGTLVTVETVWAPELEPDGSRPLFGVSLGTVVLEPPPAISFGAATLEAAGFLLRAVPQSLSGFVSAIGQTFTGQRSDDIAGPVRIVGAVGQAAQVGLAPVLFLAGIINFSLAIFNLLPIPGLDGGRMLLSTIIAIRGRPFKPGQEELIHFLGFAAIFAFIILVTFGEVSDLLTR